MDNSYIQKQIQDIENNIRKTNLLVQSSNDETIKQMATEEVHKLTIQKDALLQAIESNTNTEHTTSDKSNDNINSPVYGNCIMEIRAGAGGNEAGLFASDLYTIYKRFSEKMNWKISELSKNEGGIGNIKEVVFEITTEESSRSISENTPYRLLKNESGTHRVQRVPRTESSGRIHTSTATIAVLPIVEKTEITIRPEDLRIDTFRASGAGGQHVNKTESAIRITHLPTGVVVQCQDERSQHKNKERAMSALQSKLFQMMKDQNAKNIDDIRSTQVGSAERSEKIRTYNFPQDRLTDHRIKKSWHNLEKILMGEILPILISLRGLEV
ncbi:peptide chain release factor 1 [candidate division WWE3 bacterium RIFCSPHIGHO2_01_FULL_35_17]|uniref:Peptide chain release factor 1 n=1 Tax=candidate division WWE3 bacterium RIFCSPHIGHO2_01_FULL_35_17 TaxID=1802614 RepID=A0A1F4UPQ5_UNCKA|nr:MAG: peptide chain release factor 1 [candidate division WWE3 bacterium RIFCSPHIGHO2_01_FULL_35_17]